jgi:hypothetical protein
MVTPNLKKNMNQPIRDMGDIGATKQTAIQKNKIVKPSIWANVVLMAASHFSFSPLILLMSILLLYYSVSLA